MRAGKVPNETTHIHHAAARQRDGRGRTMRSRSRETKSGGWDSSPMDLKVSTTRCSRAYVNTGSRKRYAHDAAERFKEFAAEMVRLNVDIIVVVTTPAALAVMNATKTIPIVHTSPALGIALQSHEVQEPKDFAAAFAAIAEQHPEALLVLQDAVTMQRRNEIVDFATQQHLPSMFQEKEWAKAGGLMSYGENLPSMYRRAAYFVDRIFKGANPGDLPVEQAAKFEMVLNLRTAKAIGLAIPDSILALADEVIE
ncbi:MAG TPA: ABC transporter substrate-binding protein [Bradyrhizobium sp.]|nr:ABC transporter substrate-binding protein [Bradyrhizobium sp.]